MLKIYHLVLLSLCGFGIHCLPSQDKKFNCVLPLKPDWSFFSPLIFSTNGTLITTENVSDEIEDLTLAAGEDILLSCAPNYFKEYASEKVLTARCKKDKTLVVNNAVKNFVSELSCEMRAIEDIITPVYGCPSKDHIKSVEYGYTNPVTEKSYILGEACYDIKRGQTLFVHTKLRSKNMDIKELAFKIKHKNYLHQEHPTTYYKNELIKALNQYDLQERFRGIFGPKRLPHISAKRYINEDMLTHKQYQPILKIAWNYQIVNEDDKLDNLENLSEDIIALEKDNIEIYTGSTGILTLENQANEPVQIYLKENKFPVPKYLWTVVKSGNKATAFAILNKSTITENEEKQGNFCKSKCEEISWINSLQEDRQYQKVENGLVLCCELNEFRKTVTEMPALSDVVGLLK